MNRWFASATLAVVCVSPLLAAPPKASKAKPAHTRTESKLTSKLSRQIDEVLADPAVARAHWGIKVTAMDGTPLFSMNDGQLFQPASNTKIYTTATALAIFGPNATFETRVVAKGHFNGPQK